jgi:hypothetical protein
MGKSILEVVLIYTIDYKIIIPVSILLLTLIYLLVKQEAIVKYGFINFAVLILEVTDTVP